MKLNWIRMMQTHLDSASFYLMNTGTLWFTGLKGRLGDMQSQGWSFAVEQIRSLHHHFEPTIQLVGKHEKAKLTLLARSDRNLLRDIQRGRMVNMEDMVFHTVHVAPHIETIIYEGAPAPVFMAFDASDLYPTEITPKKIYELGTLAFFKPVEAIQEIYIPEKEIWTVEKHLEAILQEQKPYQAELRKKHLEEQRKKDLQQGSNSRAVAALVAV